MSTVPSIRATIPRTALARIRVMQGAKREAILAAVPASTLDTLDTALSVTWLPVERHLELIDAMAAHMSESDLQDTFADLYLTGFSELPAIRSIVAATLRILAPEPTSLAKNLQRTWTSLSRNLGAFGPPTAVDRGRFEIRYAGFPDPMERSRAWVHTFAGVLEGFVRQHELEGGATIMHADWSERRIDYVVQWTPR